MGRLAQTEGLSDVQRQIIDTVREFTDQKIVDAMCEMGLFGLTIPEEYGGLGESLLTYALVVEEISRGWMSISGIINTHFIVSYLLSQHGTREQKEAYLPGMAVGDVRASFSMSEPELGS